MKHPRNPSPRATRPPTRLVNLESLIDPAGESSGADFVKPMRGGQTSGQQRVGGGNQYLSLAGGLDGALL